MKIDDIVEAMKRMPKVEKRIDVLILSDYQYDQLCSEIQPIIGNQFGGFMGIPLIKVSRHEYYDVVMTHLLSGKKVAIWQNETNELVIFQSNKQGEQNVHDSSPRDRNSFHSDDSSKTYLPFTKSDRHCRRSFPYRGQKRSR